MIAVTAIVANVLIALLQRPSSSAERKFQIARSWAIVTAITSLGFTLGAVASRGYSNTSLLIVAAWLAWIGLFCCLVATTHIRVPFSADGARGVFVGVKGLRPAHNTLRIVLLVWAAVTAVATLVPAHYAGALRQDRLSSNLMAAVTPARLDPLRRPSPIAVGQCSDGWTLRPTNIVVPCAVDHRSEVVDRVDDDASCPGIDEFRTDGLQMEIVGTSPIDDAVFCVLRSTSPTRSWRGRIAPRRALPGTP